MNVPPGRPSVLVIGGGQAGLAAGYYLRQAGMDFAILDAGARVGDSWRQRYQSLTLFTPRRMTALPGLDQAGDPDGYPTKDEFADYLEAYASHFGLPLRHCSRVVSLEQIDGRFVAALADGSSFRSDAVIIATGGFQLPTIPYLADAFDDGVVQFTSVTFRTPSSLPAGPVLVVGDGAAGRDIAADCASVTSVLLARGKPRRLLTERIFGRSIWWWLRLSGILSAGPSSRFGNILRASDAFPDRDRNDAALARRGIKLVPRLVGAEGRTARFSDGTRVEIGSVVWAIGYRDDTAWLRIAGATAVSGEFRHSEGVSPIEGLYHVGRPWQRNRASALVMGAGPDARAIVRRLIDRLATNARQ